MPKQNAFPKAKAPTIQNPAELHLFSHLDYLSMEGLLFAIKSRVYLLVTIATECPDIIPDAIAGFTDSLQDIHQMVEIATAKYLAEESP